MIPFKILKYESSSFKEKTDFLASEEPLEIKLEMQSGNCFISKSLAVTMRTPGADKELIAGFLLTEGLITEATQIKEIKEIPAISKNAKGNIYSVFFRNNFVPDIKKTERNFYMTSSCGVCGKASIAGVAQNLPKIPVDDRHVKIPASSIGEMAKKMEKNQETFRQTGGLHATGFFDLKGNLVVLMEDVGRHNAFDKVIGHMLFENQIPLTSGTVFFSGRLSFELVQKAAMAGAKIICAMGAPSDLAVELADEADITAIGFAKSGNFNIYSHISRVTL